MKTIYTKDNCPGCVQLKQKYTAQGIPFKTVNIGTDISLEEFKAKFPEVRAVPYEVNDDL